MGGKEAHGWGVGLTSPGPGYLILLIGLGPPHGIIGPGDPHKKGPGQGARAKKKKRARARAGAGPGKYGLIGPWKKTTLWAQWARGPNRPWAQRALAQVG